MGHDSKVPNISSTVEPVRDTMVDTGFSWPHLVQLADGRRRWEAATGFTGFTSRICQGFRRFDACEKLVAQN